MTLAEFIQQEMDRRYGSIRGFAEMTGVVHETIRQILLGRTPYLETFEKLAVALDVPIQALLDMAGVQVGPQDVVGHYATASKEVRDLLEQAIRLSPRDLQELARYAQFLESQRQEQAQV